jgi:hypothetical protein
LFLWQLRSGRGRIFERFRLIVSICASKNGMIFRAYKVVAGIFPRELFHPRFRVGKAFHFLEPDRIFFRLAQENIESRLSHLLLPLIVWSNGANTGAGKEGCYK